MSENICKPWMKTLTISMRPTSCGTSNMARMMLLSSRSGWVTTYDAVVHIEARLARALSDAIIGAPCAGAITEPTSEIEPLTEEALMRSPAPARTHKPAEHFR